MSRKTVINLPPEGVRAYLKRIEHFSNKLYEQKEAEGSNREDWKNSISHWVGWLLEFMEKEDDKSTT